MPASPSLFGAMGAALLILLAAAAPANASAVPDVRESKAREQTKTTTISIPFSHAISLVDAVATESVGGYDVVAYEFENAEFTGEFSPLSGVSAEEFVHEISRSLETEPQVVAVRVAVPVEEAKALSRSRSAQTVPTSAAEYVAPAANPEASEQLRRFREQIPELNGQSPAAAALQRATAKASTWKPTQAGISIFRADTSTVYFEQFLYWDGSTASTTAMAADDGWEAEVNVFTSRPDAETCGSGHPQDYPFAKNYGWSWYALVNTGSGIGPMASSVGAYADYNDNSDPCNRNSIAIGIRTPQAIPAYPSGAQEVMLTVFAPRGLDNTGKIGGVIQAVNETGCVLQPWLSNTDCMGITSSSSGARATLSESRNWTAPPKCWTSSNYGNNAPVAYDCYA